jgi:hypothetical protein
MTIVHQRADCIIYPHGTQMPLYTPRYTLFNMPLFKAFLTDKEMRDVRILKAELGSMNNTEYLREATLCCKRARSARGRNVV